MRRVWVAFILSLASGCAAPMRPTRVATSRGLPETDDEKALVVFVFPPCTSYYGWTPYDMVMCRRFRQNRLRVVEHGAHLVTDIDLGEYGASYETPGHHVYAAFHQNTACSVGRLDCVAALEADLEPGRVYFVTFRWVNTPFPWTGFGGRLDFVPVPSEEEGPYRARLAQLDRVEPIHGHREAGPFRELRSVTVSSRALLRIEQDRADGVRTPRIIRTQAAWGTRTR